MLTELLKGLSDNDCKDGIFVHFSVINYCHFISDFQFQYEDYQSYKEDETGGNNESQIEK